ncbi:MAG: hypothetical protein IKJ89_03590, partial [Kiritimatiellae bacterium]|nr:hypothetical protein [Kiritimatiellia bacterium]
MNKPIKLAVIGAKGAGKTTLMAGYAAVSPNIGGMDDTSRKYLEDQFKAWDNNRWPDPTKDVHTINFRIGRNGGGDVVVSFAEYMGESFSGDHDAQYLEKFVGKPDAALLLVNPQMPDFVDTGKRSGFESDAKKVIDYLVANAGEKTKRPVLALVWTASDTESAKSEEFKSFTKQLRDYVGDRLLCEEFSVSLFGEMSDESFPPGRPTDPRLNTSPRPFEWALKILKARRISGLLVKNLLIGATSLVAVLLATFVAHF